MPAGSQIRFTSMKTAWISASVMAHCSQGCTADCTRCTCTDNVIISIGTWADSEERKSTDISATRSMDFIMPCQ